MRTLKDGTPANDHLGDILASLNPEAFQCCFVARVSALIGAPVEAIAINGKTQRRSGSKVKGQAAVHIVTAFAARQRLVLGQVKVDAKSNERRAEDQEFGRHDGQPLRDGGWRPRPKRDAEVHSHSRSGMAPNPPQMACPEDNRRGREPSRKRRQGRDGDALFITSSTLDAERLGPFARDHWDLENSLHWVLDMVFRDDECRMRMQNAPVNFANIKHIASNLLRKAPGTACGSPGKANSVRQRR